MYMHISMQTMVPDLPCVCATVRRAARVITQIYDDALRPSGLRVTQFTILQVLHKAGDLTQSQLGRVLAMDSTTLSRTLKLLEDKGSIASYPGEDRRERHLSVAARGKAQFETAEPLWSNVQARLKGAPGAPDWDQFLNVLDRVTNTAQSI